jgi:BirA family biotin operon repressor/biotin-[acetyl-CoA-carboxylase] ligase
MNETRHRILERLDTGPQTGPELAASLDLSRAAVWKQIEALRDDGFEIGTGADGYELVAIPEYGGAAVEFGLEAPYRVEYHETVGSTNDVARDLAEAGESDVVVLADEQTGGRGRKDRGWRSPSGGIWLSILLRPSVPPARVPVLTLGASVAVVEAVASAGVDASIKWPNDVLARTETGEAAKLAGILTEMAGESAQVSWVVIGIGLNANVDLAAVGDGATTLRALVGDVDRRSVVQAILEGFNELAADPDSILPAWRERTSTLGRTVRIETESEVIEGTATDVTDVGALVVETETGRQTVHTGDCEHLRPLE